jgi:hypothetical protein
MRFPSHQWRTDPTALAGTFVQTVHGSYSDEVRPSIGIQAEFGAAGTPSKLEGGQGTVWRVGDVTLKPVDVLPEELLWLDEVAQFAALFSDMERPAFIDLRSHAWARADRFAWGEDDGGLPIAVPHVADLVSARRQVFDPLASFMAI